MQRTITAPLPFVAICVLVFIGTRCPAADIKNAESITFADRTWKIKIGQERGPGPNDWSNRKECVRVDNKGRLHLGIAPSDQSWTCSEVVAPRSLGYGVYRWVVSGNLPSLNARSVLGLFVYEDDRNEIDFELSRWAIPGDPNAQFVLQPESKDSKHRFDLKSAKVLTCSFDWSPSAVQFRCWTGKDISEPPVAQWKYTGTKIPRPGNERVHMNFWVAKGKRVAGDVPQEVIIESFEFIPAIK